MAKKVTQKNFDKVLTKISEHYAGCNKIEKKIWTEELDKMLNELWCNDFFGTEGQSDPRGDRRED